MRARGDIETFDLGEISGVTGLGGVVASIKHVGPGLLRGWQERLRRFRVEEMARVLNEREGQTKETRPELWPDDDSFVIPSLDGPTLFADMQETNVAECIVALTGRAGLSEAELKDPKALAAEVRNLGAVEALAMKAMEVQQLTPATFPAPEGASGVSAEPATSAD